MHKFDLTVSKGPAIFAGLSFVVCYNCCKKTEGSDMLFKTLCLLIATMLCALTMRATQDELLVGIQMVCVFLVCIIWWLEMYAFLLGRLLHK